MLKTPVTFANITDNFVPGEVYNIGGKVEWEKDIKEISDLIIKKLQVKMILKLTTKNQHLQLKLKLLIF